MATSFNVNINDLQYILKQIKIAEDSSVAYAHAGGAATKTIIQSIMDTYGATAANAAQLPAGLRTVDGSNNNLLPGRSEFGAADNLFPRLTDPVFRTVDGPGIDFNGDGLVDVVNHYYGDTNGPNPGGIKSVVDVDPRVISNLIVSMTVDNAAAVEAYLSNPLSLEQFEADHPGKNPVAPGGVVNANDLEITNSDLQTIPNQSPDIGLSPGFNAWMTFFGQFFDHGLDLVTKGNNGTVYVPLQADDPLYDKGKDGIANNVVHARDAGGNLLYYVADPSGTPVGAPPPQTTTSPTAWTVKFNDDGFGADGLVGTADDRPNFMALSRATATIDANGVPQHENTTTSWIDQNQTYTSHASHQVFLREYKSVGGHAVSTGKLLDGGVAGGGSKAEAIGNWFEVKDQALKMLGIALNDFDVHNVPLLLTDQYGKFIPGANGYAQLVMKPDAEHANNWLKEGTAAGVTTEGAELTGHAFLNDIAHHAVPTLVDADHNPATAPVKQTADVDSGAGDDGNPLTYDDEMLNAHFVTGDGRGNENIALTSVHSIFHSEHNRLVDVNKATLLENATTPEGLAFLNEWLLVDVTAAPTTPGGISALQWDGERLFQAARFGTEMQYQHLVFEEFARRVQPMVDPFIFNSAPEIDPSIVAEFAHTVYRFGHSMLTGTVDRLENDLTTVNGDTSQKTLLAVFLNPQAYLASGADVDAINANIIRGLSRDVGNEIDEMIVSDVRSNLLGLPLDLGALNISRARDTGVPSLNETRAQLYESTALADLKPYANWIDFAEHIKNPLSIVNFIAAYGTHTSIQAETTLAGKRAAAEALVFDTYANKADRDAFLNGTGGYISNLGGLNDVDLWIGGLAEAKNEFGGMLGSTFNYVFEAQMENLQFGDRMYYLTRTQGLNFLNNLEPNTFSDLVMRNTALGDEYSTHLNGALFVTPDHILEMDTGIAQEDYNGAVTGLDPTWAIGEPHSVFASKVTRTPGTLGSDGHLIGGELHFLGGEHVVVGGTEGNDRIFSDRGIDTLWGDGGNDYLNAGMESDDVFGGEGDDIIEDPFGDDVLRGNQGNDVISDARGANLLFGDEGRDYIIMGQDAAETFGGEGNDFILGGAGKDFLLGNEGDDWIEGGAGFDTIAGDNSELFFNSTVIGHDVMFHGSDEGDFDAESGDDIMGSGPSVLRYEGMFGFDWGIAKNDITGVQFDLQIPIFTTIPNDVLRDRFDQVEALSGWKFGDVLEGDDRGHKGGGSSAPDSIPVQLFADHLLTQEGINRIDGLNAWFGGFDGTDARQTLFGGASPVPGSTPVSTFRDGNILMGGDGNDFLRGRGGYDILDGDSWLNVRIKIVVPSPITIDGVTYQAGTYSAESMSTDTVLSGEHAGLVFPTDAAGHPIFTTPAFGGASLNSLMLKGHINPGNMTIVREILDGTVGANETDNDTAIFQGTFAEYEIEGSRDFNGDGDFNDANEFGASFDRNNDGDYNDSGEFNTRARDINGDGFISVRDRDTGAIGAMVDGVAGSSRGALTDDHDLIRNIEQLQFADRTVTIAGNNHLATGTVTISDATPFDGKVTPYVGQILVPTLSNFADLEGIPLDSKGMPVGLTFEWETTEFGSNSGWSTIQTSDTYQVRPVDPGHVLRAVAVFKDAAGNTERIFSVETDNPTALFSVTENSVSGTTVGLQIPFSVDYDSQSIGGAPPVDVDLTTLYHEVDPANSAGGRFKVVLNGVDFNGFPRYSLVVDQGGPVTLNYEAPVHTAANQSHQFVDNQYQVIINSYSDTPANGGTLVAVRQFTVLINDVTGEIADVVPTVDLNADATVTTPTAFAQAYRDQFDAAAYNNSNGTSNWTAAAWTETGDNGSATTGEIAISGGRLSFNQGADHTDAITRAVNGLPSDVASATLSFTYQSVGLDNGVLGFGDRERVIVEVRNSTSGSWTQIGDLGGNTTGDFSQAIPLALIGANTQIRLRVDTSSLAFGNTTLENGESFSVDNLNIAISRNIISMIPGTPGNNYSTSYTEGGAEAAVASNPAIGNDHSGIMSATVRLTNAQAQDALSIAGALPAGITASFGPAVAGEITMYLTGFATLANYQTAIQAVRFSNSGDNPNPTVAASPRTIQVSVNDGVNESLVATATVTVNPVNDAPSGGDDAIVTNFASGTAFVIPEWVLLANDVDPEGATLDVTGLSAVSGLTALLGTGSVSVTDTGTAGGSFAYTVSDGSATDPTSPTVSVTRIAPANTTTYSENFGTTSYSEDDGAWTDNWTESGDDNSSTGANGQIRINGGQLQFDAGNNAAASNGAQIQRVVNLAGATSATLSYSFSQNIDAGETVQVQFAKDGSTFETVQTISSSSVLGNTNFALTGPFTANATLRFVVSTMNVDADVVSIDNISIAFTTPVAVNGGNNGEILIGDVNGSTFDAGGGNDIVLAGDGNDFIVWNANNSGSTDGRDFVDGGAGSDTFDVNTRGGTNESFRVYTVASALSGPNAIAGLTTADLKPGTEIIITRTTNGDPVSPASIIAELDNIEEIRIGTQTADPTNGSAGSGDTVAIFGDFSTTSLALNTITIDGNAGDDTVDISALTSAHRIVFRSNGGNDTIIGNLRPQDVIELPAGTTAIDYVTTSSNGITKMTGPGGHTITYTAAPAWTPVIGTDDEEDEDGDAADNKDDSDDNCGNDDDTHTPGGTGTTAPVTGVVRTGTPAADVLTGTAADDNIVASAGDDFLTGDAGADAISAGEGADFVSGGDGRDVVFAGAGDDQVFGGGQADVIYGDAGADRLFGDGGNDLINAGAGDDAVFGGAGNDLIVAETGDGNDVYFGDDSDGGTGIDTLDMSAATANVTVNLGSGPLSNGTASSSQTGHDTIWGIENVNTGSGHDTITASNAVNVINGGAGNDTFKFTSASAADGDTILGFEPGDRLDLTAIDANVSASGDQSFMLVTGAPLAAGQLGVTHETRDGEQFTVVQGNIDGNADADFTIEIAGHHTLTSPTNVGL